jgi:hypothetical protein
MQATRPMTSPVPTTARHTGVMDPYGNDNGNGFQYAPERVLLVLIRWWGRCMLGRGRGRQLATGQRTRSVHRMRREPGHALAARSSQRSAPVPLYESVSGRTGIPARTAARADHSGAPDQRPRQIGNLRIAAEPDAPRDNARPGGSVLAGRPRPRLAGDRDRGDGHRSHRSPGRK